MLLGYVFEQYDNPAFVLQMVRTMIVVKTLMVVVVLEAVMMAAVVVVEMIVETINERSSWRLFEIHLLTLARDANRL